MSCKTDTRYSSRADGCGGEPDGLDACGLHRRDGCQRFQDGVFLDFQVFHGVSYFFVSFAPPNTYIKQLPFSWSASFRSLFSQTRECFQSNERARDKRGQMASASRKRFAAFPASFAPSMLANEEVELVACKSVSASQREFKFLAGEH